MSGEKKRDAVASSAFDEDTLADLIGFVAAGRHDRLVDVAMETEPPEVRAQMAAIYNTLAALAYQEDAVTPSAELRGRILATVAAKRAKKTALVVIDMIVDHLTPGRILEVPRAREIVPALAKRLDEARANGTPVVYIVDQHDADDPDLDAWGAHAIAGSGGDDVWPPIAPKTGDRVVHKPTYSAFVQSDLEKVLDELGVDTVVLTGCLTELGIMATATDALQRGFAVEVPRDTQAGSREDLENATLTVLSAMAPFGPARRARLKQLESRAA